MADYILAIDQGTTGSTVLVFDRTGRIQGRAYAEFPQMYPQPGWVEHDATRIWDDCRKLVAAALRDAGRQPSDVAAIGITNQRETMVCWDRETGRPVANAIVWQDRRTADYCEQLKVAGHEDLIQQKTGLLIDPYFFGTKLRWLLTQDNSLRKRAGRGEIVAGTVDSWLIWNLTGGRQHVTDYSNASRTLFYDIRELAWDAELLALLDVPQEMMPSVVPSSGPLGVTDAQIFDGVEIPISGIAGDQQAALFGQACFTPGRVKNTYGTGSFLLMHTGTEAPVSKQRLLTTIAWRLGDEPVEYALEGAVFVSGAAVQWLRDGLGVIEQAAETQALAESLADNEGVYFVPALTGLGAPHWDPYARGTIVGLTRGTTKAHLARAALEAICYQSRDVVEAMSRDAGLPLTELRADGGAVVNSFLMQFQADTLGVPVRIPEIHETTALGAAYLAGLGVGFWESREQIQQHWIQAAEYTPAMDEQQRAGSYARWQEAVARSKDWEPRG
jgi:glycerol kinase